MTDPAPTCLFCRIVAGELPADVVYDSDTVIGFRDIAPVAPVHVLLVPKVHRDDVAHLASDDGPLAFDLLQAARAVATAEGVADSGYRLVFNVGHEGGNTVPHLHLHLLGRRPMTWPPG